MSARPSPRNEILLGDAATVLRTLPDDYIDLMVTSPPYFRLRDYQIDGQIGLEAHVDHWVDHLARVVDGLDRVLKPSGTLWLNLGDSYSTHLRQGAPRKSLLLGPERIAHRLIANGWTLRNKIIWAKANPMPSSVRDRLACTHEYVYVFAHNSKYHFGLDAIRVPHTSIPSKRHRVTAQVRGRQQPDSWRGPNADTTFGLTRLHAQGIVGHPNGKNPGDVWRIPSSGFRGAHHATFPTELARRAIQAGCPAGGIVLDPFIGSGTTAIAAEQLGRDWLGIELNPDFKALADARIATDRARRVGAQARTETA